jgi:alpha-1,2-mannosyltransferase
VTEDRNAQWRFLLWALTVGAAVGQCWAAHSRPFERRLDDLQMYAGSVRSLLDGGSLYDYVFQRTGAPFTYPPFGGLLLAPVGLVGIDELMLCWTAATIALVVALAQLIAAAGPQRLPRPLAVPAIAMLLLLSAPVSSNLRYGQVSLLVVAAVLLDCLRAVPPRYIGVATGIAAATKLTPLVFVPYFWLSGQRRVAVTAAATFAGCCGLGWLVLPADSLRFWGTEVFDIDGMGAVAHGGNQSLNAFLLRADLSAGVRIAAVATVGSAVVLIALARAARAWRNGRALAAAVIVGAAGLVFSPVSWTHHQVWLVLAALLRISSRRSWNTAWTALVALIMVVPVSSVGANLPGGLVTENSRLLLAVLIACAVPFTAIRRPRPAPAIAEPAQSDPRAIQLQTNSDLQLSD